MMRALQCHVLALALIAVLLVSCATPPGSTATPLAAESGSSLKSVGAFRHIANRTDRSVALYKEAARVIENPRCMNCHPANRTPTQGDDLHPHVPTMRADDKGHGIAGLDCNACHQSQNTATHVKPIESIPGHAHWMLAPPSMSWQGKTTGQICEQIKDPARNGGRSLAMILEHMSRDSLVGWAWAPGAGRQPAPGTQQEFGQLLAAWIETGAACPSL